MRAPTNTYLFNCVRFYLLKRSRGVTLKEILITNDTKNQRLDKFLGKYLNDAPKSFIYKMLRKKNIKLNGKKAQGSEILAENDIVHIYMADDTVDKFRSEKNVNQSAGEIDIVYEDEHILIVNKPRGLLTHPDSPNQHDTLLGRTLSYLHKKGEYDISRESVFTPGFCNRLDRNTTGIVVCGKTLNALQQLNKAISCRESKKYYHAIVLGEVKSGGVLQGYHTKDQSANKVAISDTSSAGDKAAITEYEPIAIANGHSLLKIKLITGRSHQIRAHLSGIGHPILGDTKYGEKIPSAPKFQMLHSASICFSSLTNELESLNGILFEAAAPMDFKFYVDKLFGGM